MKIRDKEYDRSIIQDAVAKVKPGLKKYKYIQDMVKVVNVSNDKQFQRTFNGFYRMRQRSRDFYKIFYCFLEENKGNLPSFEDTLVYIYSRTKRVEASFSSKLVATINPNLPIWDTVVLKNLNLTQPAYHLKDRIPRIISIYSEINEWYKSFLKNDESRYLIKMFDEIYPDSKITNIKKIDFILWQIRN